jgi:DNA-binding PadR family transcriptional regulator
MGSERPHGQEDVDDVILNVLSHGRAMTTQEITRTTKARLDLTPADLRRANKRENESKIDQIIANALQARRRLCGEGLIERIGHGEFRITDEGRKSLREQAELMQLTTSILDDLHPDLK